MTGSLFASDPGRYDRWYDRHPELYRAELAALKRAGGDFPGGLEVGVGTGRFAAALGIRWGIDPAAAMLDLARRRGCRVLRGEGEHLPFADAAFGRVLLVTVLCFVRDPGRVIGEAFRVLRPGGELVLGIIDPESELGRATRARRDPDSFYASARFLSVDEVLRLLPEKFRGEARIFQAIFPEEAGTDSSPAVEPGHGRGAFVAVSVPTPVG
ncbi:MAG: class I SAM-dependent methyltransferase [Candidatus Erginobacter occultus]|nr:class I SAM-dependent methyltransferase [Candidatus Erginobacter occultus]